MQDVMRVQQTVTALHGLSAQAALWVGCIQHLLVYRDDLVSDKTQQTAVVVC